MADPTKKSPELEQTLDETTKHAFGRPRSATIQSDRCVTCGGEAKEFRDDLSRREYQISGMCQSCQDKTFGIGPCPECSGDGMAPGTTRDEEVFNDCPACDGTGRKFPA